MFVAITATNIKGTSLISETGTGAIIITKPDAPVSLAEIEASRSSSTLEIEWTDGASDGLSTIIDYRLSMAI